MGGNQLSSAADVELIQLSLSRSVFRQRRVFCENEQISNNFGELNGMALSLIVVAIMLQSSALFFGANN